MNNQLLGPETITPQDQVVVLTGLVEKDGGFEAHLDVRHPYDGGIYSHVFAVPREVDPLHPVWDGLNQEFQRLFPRRENMLAYRDTAKTLILEAVYALTKTPPPKVEKKETDGS